MNRKMAMRQHMIDLLTQEVARLTEEAAHWEKEWRQSQIDLNGFHQQVDNLRMRLNERANSVARLEEEVRNLKALSTDTRFERNELMAFLGGIGYEVSQYTENPKPRFVITKRPTTRKAAN